MKMQEFLKDATLVLANRVDWQPEVGVALVMKKLIEKLPGEPWGLRDEN